MALFLHYYQVLWFYGDSNPELNSKPLVEARKIVHKHFGSEGTEELVSQLTKCLEEKENEFLQVVSMSQEEVSNTSALLNSIQEATRSDPPKAQENAKDEKPSTSSDHSKSVEKGTGVQSAFKRKSNGQPIVMDPAQSNLPKEKVTVKISTCKGQKRTFKLQPQTTVKDLNALIHSSFHIPVEKQILKYGFPPQILDSSGVIELKSGDQIKVDEKSAERRDMPKVKPDLSASDKKLFDPIASTSGLFSKLEQLKRDFELSSSANMWDYCCENPQLFLPGGVFYQQFEIDIGLKHKSHCSFSLIPGKRFQFNEHYNRIELCLEPAGHFPIDSDILQVIKKFATTNVSDSASPSPSADNSEFLNKDPNFINPRLAPGFLTVGDQPTILTADEIDSQRNELKRMVQQLSDEKK